MQSALQIGNNTMILGCWSALSFTVYCGTSA